MTSRLVSNSSFKPHTIVVASMTKKIITVAVLLAVVVFVVLSLLRGASYLETPLPGGLPLGNVLAALGLCAMAGAATALSLRGTGLRTAALASLVGAALWLPASVLLAGNPQLNFGGGRGATWLVFSVAVFAYACTTLLWALGASVLAKIRGAGAV